MNSAHEQRSYLPAGAQAQAETSVREKLLADECPLKILVADDHYINRRVFVMFLKHLGYQPDSVENGLECLNAAMEGHYDLLLTDLEMPEMTGLECAFQLRRAGVKVRIIAVSASGLERPLETCLAVGMDGFLPKPFPANQLRQILKETYLLKMTTIQTLPSIA